MFKELLFRNTNSKQIITKNLIWLLITQGSRLFRGLIIIYAARLLGTEKYGLFSYILGFVGVMMFFSDLGISEIVTRDIAKNKEKRDEYFMSGFWIRIFLIFISCLILVFLSPYLLRFALPKTLIFMAIIFFAIDSIRKIMISYARGLERMELETLATVVMNLVLILPGILILINFPTPKSLLYIYLLGSTVGLILLLITTRGIFNNIFKSFNTEVTLEILKNCWPIAVFGLFSIISSLDTVMLSWWQTPTEIGIYSAGQKLVQFLYNGPIILATAIFPTLSSIVHAKNYNKEKILNEASVTLTFFFTLPILVGGIILSRYIMEFVYGAAYLSGVNVFRILILNIGLVFPGTIVSGIVVAHNQQLKILKYAVPTFLANIGLNIILIPKMGILGPAIATLIAQSLNYLLIWREIKKTSYFETIPHIKNLVIASVLMGLVSFGLNKLHLHLILNVLFSAIIYLAYLFFSNEKILVELRNILIKTPFIKTQT